MGRLIDIEAKDKNDTTPDPLMAMIFFFIATSIYCVISIFLMDSHQRLIAKVCYVLCVVIGEYFINLTLTRQMCGVVQWKTTMFITLLPWILIFGVLHLFITMFPGWTGPFSNTFGYLVTKLMGLPDLMNVILEDSDKGAATKTPASLKALENIRSDNSLFINELFTESREKVLALADKEGNPIIVNNKQQLVDPNVPLKEGQSTTQAKDTGGNPMWNRPKYEKAWKKLQDAEIIKKFPGDENAIMMDKLYYFVQMKNTISEYVWNLLSGFLVTSISYNYIINTGCAKSPTEMKKRHDDYEAEQNKKQKENQTKEANAKVYTQS